MVRNKSLCTHMFVDRRSRNMGIQVAQAYVQEICGSHLESGVVESPISEKRILGVEATN